MRETELKYFYPYTIDKQYSFSDKLKNSDLFADQLLGKNEYFYKDENNYGYRRNNDVFTEKEYSINSYIHDTFTIWRTWYKQGRNIFSFSQELLEMLNVTDVDEITYEAFNLPYDDFYISLKPLNLRVLPNSDKIIEGVFVSVDRQAMEVTYENDPNLPYDFAISFNFVGDFQDLKLMYHDKIWDLRGAGGISFWDYAFFFLQKEKIITVKDAIRETKEVFKGTYFPENPEEVTDTELDILNHHIRFIQNTSIILVNCLLYLSLPKESKDIKLDYPVDLPYNYNKKLSFAKSKKETTKIRAIAFKF